MEIQIFTEPFQLLTVGLEGTILNKDYAGSAFKLSAKVWEVLKLNAIKNKGKNIWLYDHNDKVFTGVELEGTEDVSKFGLLKKQIHLPKYAYYKHVGSYSHIKHAGVEMRKSIAEKGFSPELPYLEIYGHWNSDETKLETELIMCLK